MSSVFCDETITERDDGLLLETGQITLAQYLERWLEDSARPTVRPRTCAAAI